MKVFVSRVSVLGRSAMQVVQSHLNDLPGFRFLSRLDDNSFIIASLVSGI